MKLRIPLLFLVAATLGACDGVSLDEYFVAELDADCERRARCGEWTSKEECIAWNSVHASHRELDLHRSVDEGRISYEPRHARACLEHLRNASCDWTSEERRTDDAECDAVFRGTVPTGGSCFTEEDCTGDCFEVLCGDTCCAGECVDEVRAAIGESCEADECVEGAFCNSNDTCARLAAEGAACEERHGCGYGLDCVDGTCRDAPERGEACPGNICANDAGDRCDQITLTCVARSALGEPCAYDEACQEPLACGPASVCVELPGIGAPCLDVFCGRGAFCDAGVCAAPRPTGAPCSWSLECETRSCNESGVCAEPVPCGEQPSQT